MFVCHFAGQVHDVARPANRRHAIRERLVNHRIQRFIKATRGFVVVAHAAFFTHHHAFGIEFAQHRILHTVGFEPHEQFNLVLWERHNVGGHQVARESVQACTARSLVGAPKFILHKNFAVFIHHRIVFGSKLFHLRGIASNNRRANQSLQAILRRHEFCIGNAVRNSHLLGALEKLMFQNVSKTRLARNLVHGTRHIKQAAAHRRRLLIRVQQHRKPIRQNLFVYNQVHLGKRRSRKHCSAQSRHAPRKFLEQIHYTASPLFPSAFLSLANLTISSAISFAFCVFSL